MQYQVISTDNHINEPPGTYVDRVPAALRDRAPRIMRGPDGGDGWSFDGKPPKTTFGLGAVGATSEQNYKQYRTGGIKFEELLPGNYEGAAHIKDNERDGVDAATIYPAAVGAAYGLQDRELALACVRAYNDWLIEDFCSADPKRLLSLPFMPVDDGIETIVREAERVVAKGAAGLYLPLPDVAYHDAMYAPLWKVAVEARIPVTIHRVGVNKRQNVEAVLDAAPGLNVVGIVQRFFSAINPISNIIFTGLFERFPDLVFVAAEVNCAWLPALAQQMDSEFERMRHWSNLPFTKQPSSYLGKNVFVTILDDFVGCNMAKTDPVLAAATMFSSDYPHSTTLWPRSKEYIAKMTDGMSADTRHAILAGNAVRAYGLN
ncbi:MAG TPA: amidohydrolase family protein [Candidatus Angelobacter sp.]|jgi:predicted TIM-barrel fold metal-dependent hydrolase|nr:amidohydrolase family protein [Candidatus Angelobacter sp.]